MFFVAVMLLQRLCVGQMNINEILEKTIPGLGYELVDVEISPAKIVRVFIDKQCGVTIEDCENVSDHLSKLFLVEEIEYNRLEISSPGVERPLKKIEDFIRFNGQIVKIKLRELINEQKVYQGKIITVEGNIIKLALEKDEILTIDFNNLVRSRLVYDFRADLKSHKKTKSA
ncbi:MAG: ribosome maturation factor RimP [Burkholderiales bacterium]|jgi:ribosome maturation factor RimP|nr:ribosome maturation factor RimP [Burkholderiales bacterium]